MSSESTFQILKNFLLDLFLLFLITDRVVDYFSQGILMETKILEKTIQNCLKKFDYPFPLTAQHICILLLFLIIKRFFLLQFLKEISTWICSPQIMSGCFVHLPNTHALQSFVSTEHRLVIQKGHLVCLIIRYYRLIGIKGTLSTLSFLSIL